MVTCQSSEFGWEVTVKLPADFLSLGRGSVSVVLYYQKNYLINLRIWVVLQFLAPLGMQSLRKPCAI